MAAAFRSRSVSSPGPPWSHALPALARLAEPFLASPKSAPTLHVTETETGLDIDITGVERAGGLSADARARGRRSRPRPASRASPWPGDPSSRSATRSSRFGPARVALPPGAFLQAVAGAEAAMAADPAAGAPRRAGGRRPLLRRRRLRLPAGDDRACRCRRCLGAGDRGAQGRRWRRSPGLKAIDAQARDLERRPVLAAELARIDVVVFDPPRAGAAAQARRAGALQGRRAWSRCRAIRPPSPATRAS